MHGRVRKISTGRRLAGIVKRGFFTVGAVILFVRDALIRDLRDILRHGRLFVGMAFVSTGLLSFASGRYCDGMTSSYVACTRPSTYYYYSWWAITLVVVGLFFIVLWSLRSKKK